MRTLRRKLRRDLFRMAGTITAIVGIMSVGVACMVCMGFSYRNLNQAKSNYYTQCRMADFSVELKKAPRAELETVAAMPGVMEIRGRIRSYAVIDLPSSKKPLSGLMLSLPDERKPVIDDIVLRQGGYFTDRRDNEVLVNDAFAREHGIKPGDWIHVLMNNRRQELFVVGTAISSEFVYLLGPGALAPDPKSFGVFYLKESYAEDVFDFDGACNEIIGRLTPDVRRHPGEFLRRVENRLDAYGVFATTPLEDQASNKYLSQEIEGLRSFAVFLPAVFLFVAALVLNILLRRLVESQRTVIGTLKATGYSDAEIFRHYLSFGLVVGMLGAVAGVALGTWLAGNMTEEYKKFFEFPELRNGFYWDLVLVAVGVTLGFAVLGTMWSTRKVLRLRPAEAMRPKPPRRGGGILVDRIDFIWQRLSSAWRLVIRGIIREPPRTLTAVFATALGASLLVSGFMMTEATFVLIDHQFKWVQRSDYSLGLKDARGFDALYEAARLPGVDYAEPVLNVACDFTSGPYRFKGAVTGIPRDARLISPRDVEGEPLRIPETGLVMNRKLAEILHVAPGDFITFRPIKGERREQQVQVTAISDSFLGTAVYADIDYLGHLIDEEQTLTGVELLTNHNPRDEAALYAEIKRMPAINSVYSRHDLIENLQTNVLDLLWVFIGMLVLFAGIVFFGTILNASLVGLEQRRRELGTLWVLGYGPWEIGAIILRESMTTSLVGMVLGIPIGYGLTVLTSMLYDTEVMRFPVVMSASTCVWTFILGVIFTLAAHAVVQRIILRTDWPEALQAKE